MGYLQAIFLLLHSLLFVSISPAIAQDQKTATFCAIADVPYDDAQADILLQQLQTQIPSSCSFLLHLGDLRANSGQDCSQSEFQAVADILATSPVPVFVLLGDNDWNDCGNPATAYSYWEEIFLYFDTAHWTHNLNVVYQPGRPYNFVISIEDSLVFGLQIVGGNVPDTMERETRLQDQYDWVEQVTFNQ